VNTNSKYIAADYEQYKVIVDTLADSDSVSRDKFCQLETIISSLTHSQAATHQQVLQSTEQQRTVIKHLITQLEDLDTQHKQLQTFIDDCTRVSDPALRRTLDSQQVIVKTMQREVDLYRQDIRARMTSEMDTLRQTLADVAINTILAR
jgi:ATP/maltotriose-dependent transcriptional regulator MalT